MLSGHVVSAAMQVQDTAECFTGRLLLVMVMRMHAIDYIAIQSIDDDKSGRVRQVMYKAVGFVQLKDSQPQADPTND